MNEMGMNTVAILSGLIALGGLTIAAWAIRAGQRIIMAQGMSVLMLGLGLLFMSLMPSGELRTSLSIAMFVGAAGWTVVQLRFIRIERRS
jgi:hypothetical protein